MEGAMINDPISEAKFDAVQQLVDQQDYAGARLILKGINDPAAREWERKIDALQPPPKLSNRSAHLIIATIAFAIGGIALIVVFATLLDYRIDYGVRSIAIVLAIVGFVVAYVTYKLGKR
jgi:VIT1/CCC1 family predicted Fe2+/Mn2+ transporter